MSGYIESKWESIDMSNIWPSIVRTLTPQLVAWVAIFATKAGLDIRADDPMVAILVAQLFAGVYYITVRVLEELRGSRWGWLLGKPGKPAYYQEGK